MPTFEVTVARDEDLLERLEAEKAKHPEYDCYQPPSFQERTADTKTAIQDYRVDESKIVEEVEEPTTCEKRKLLGGTCGRELPCRYHK